MFARSRSSSICLRCLTRRAYSTANPTSPNPSELPSSTSSSSSARQPPPPPPASGAAKLTNRRLIALHGHDTPHFLQGLTTANIRPNHTHGLYGAFLNAQGRVLNDVFIYPTSHSAQYRATLPQNLSPDDPAYIIEVDAAEATKLVAHLRRHKLRSKVNIALLDPGAWDVWSVWKEDERWTPHYAEPYDSSFPQHHDSTADHHSSSNSGHGQIPPGQPHSLSSVDGRAPGMGRRVLTIDATRPPALDEAGIPETSLAAYTVRRMLHGVPEGQAEILRESSLPLESNIDFMGGVDFRKGCYVGQELTIRTHHTGVVRKRILPVQLYEGSGSTGPEGSLGSELQGGPQELQYNVAAGAVGETIPPNTNILKANNAARARSSAGKFLAGIGNVGLALCRIEVMTDLALTGQGTKWSPEDEFVIRYPVGGAGNMVDTAGANEQGQQQVKVKAFIPCWHKHKGTIDLREQR